MGQTCCSKAEVTPSDMNANPKRGLLESAVDAYKNVKKSVAGTIDEGFDYVSPYWLTLQNITESDNLYYTKCTTIGDKFIDNKFNRNPPIIHESETHSNDWDSILSNATKCQPPLYEFLDHLVEGMHSFYADTDKDSNENKTEVAQASLKKLKRAKEKVETNYDGNWLRLCDVCRSSIVHDSFEDLYYILLILYKYRLNCFGFQIVKIKNRYKRPTDQGWADITLLIEPTNKRDVACETMDAFLFENDSKQDANDRKIKEILNGFEMDTFAQNNLAKHICEVQLIHRSMWNKRKSGLFGHGAYGLVRSVDATAVNIGDKLGAADTVNEMIDFRGNIMGGIGQKIFVRDNKDETAGSIVQSVSEQLSDEAKYVFKRVTSADSDNKPLQKDAEKTDVEKT